MNKSLLVASLAVLSASVFGMNPGYNGESSNANRNQPFHNIRWENPRSNNRNAGINLLDSIRNVLSENENLRAIDQERNRAIRNLADQLAEAHSSIANLSEQVEGSQNLRQRLTDANLRNFNNQYRNNARKRSRNAGEEQLQQEFAHLNQRPRTQPARVENHKTYEFVNNRLFLYKKIANSNAYERFRPRPQ